MGAAVQHYIGYGAVAAGGADKESFIELWNASTSYVKARVTLIRINTKDTIVKLKYHTAKQGSTAKTSGNKELGGKSPGVAIYGDSATSVSGTQIGSIVCTVDTDRTLDLNDAPIVINPGKSLIIENTDANEAITSLEIHWEETPAPGTIE